MTGCAYCGHPDADHFPDGCAGDVPGIPPSRWRHCTCTTYREPEPA